MASERDPFARKNRGRLVVLILLSVVNYWMAVCAAAVATGIVLVLWVAAEGGISDLDGFKVVGVLLVVAFILGAIVGSFIAVVQIPLQRRNLERKVLAETGAVVAAPDVHPRVRNLLEGLAIAADVPVPRFAVIVDPSPNSFGVGTRPKKTIIGVTTGLIEKLSRDELEAILSYEVSRIRSWDVALSSWTVALTSGALGALEDEGFKQIVGYLPLRFASWIQLWAVRGQALERDRAAVRMTRNPAGLLAALERLHTDPSEVRSVTAYTAPLWVEVPSVLAHAPGARSARVARELLLDQRIDALRQLALQG